MASTKTKRDTLHETKKSLTIFCPSKESPLSYADLLVYCYRADQFRYGALPTNRRVAKGTGLKEGTVAEATTRLTGHDLLDAEAAVISPCRRMDWFITNDKLKEMNPDKSEFSWFQNWKTLIRQPGADNPLTLPCVLVYGVIRHSIFQGWKPSSGWTHEYLALLTATNPKTVSKSLETLEANGFLSVLDGMRFRLYGLRESQLACFADRCAWSGNSSEPDELVEEVSSASAQLDERHAARKALAQYLQHFFTSDEPRKKLFNIIVQSPHPVSTWRDQVDWYMKEIAALDAKEVAHRQSIKQ